MATKPPTPLTNIGTSVPPRSLPSRPPRAIPPALPVGGNGQRFLPAGLHVALPVAVPEGTDPGRRVIAPDPLWIARWQPSATAPLSRAPWVIAYRFWRQGVAYQTRGMMTSNVLSFWFNDGFQCGHEGVPDSMYHAFVRLTSSVGQWYHRNILGPGWRPGAGPLYTEVAP